ncbi:MAG TPA: XdhC family protein [Abditibacteriaceae bacterium]|jgi:xanthine dehydrogenase accessory factor
MANYPLDTEVHQQLVQLLEQGHNCALVTILRASGSVPRQAGTKAIVSEDGSLWGTIGGGLLEAKAQQVAMECLQSKQIAVFDFSFSGASAQNNEPICGGNLRVFVDPNVKQNFVIYEQVARSLKEHQRGTLLTTLQKSTSQVNVTWLLDATEEINNFPFDESVKQALNKALDSSSPIYFVTSDGQSEGLAEPLQPTPLLLIAGGGHVGQALSWQARLVGFRIAVYDDRPEFCQPSLYPPGTLLRSNDVRDFFDEFPRTPDTYIALVGRNHQVDMRALKLCLHSSAAYIGVMGSQRKIALMRREFKDYKEQLDRLYAPIGLDIKAQTVPEIAASIVGQLIAVRRGAKISS